LSSNDVCDENDLFGVNDFCGADGGDCGCGCGYGYGYGYDCEKMCGDHIRIQDTVAEAPHMFV